MRLGMRGILVRDLSLVSMLARVSVRGSRGDVGIVEDGEKKEKKFRQGPFRFVLIFLTTEGDRDLRNHYI